MPKAAGDDPYRVSGSTTTRATQRDRARAPDAGPALPPGPRRRGRHGPDDADRPGVPRHPGCRSPAGVADRRRRGDGAPGPRRGTVDDREGYRRVGPGCPSGRERRDDRRRRIGPSRGATTPTSPAKAGPAQMMRINAAFEAIRHGQASRRLRPRAPPAAKHDGTGGAGPPPGRPSGSVLDFGRHIGWSIGEIARFDPGYLEWLEAPPRGPSLSPRRSTRRCAGCDPAADGASGRDREPPGARGRYR